MLERLPSSLEEWREPFLRNPYPLVRKFSFYGGREDDKFDCCWDGKSFRITTLSSTLPAGDPELPQKSARTAKEDRGFQYAP
ncbi:hypothetical protein J3R74_000762 [Puniceicoccus vermicola]